MEDGRPLLFRGKNRYYFFALMAVVRVTHPSERTAAVAHADHATSHCAVGCRRTVIFFFWRGRNAVDETRARLRALSCVCVEGFAKGAARERSSDCGTAERINNAGDGRRIYSWREWRSGRPFNVHEVRRHFYTGPEDLCIMHVPTEAYSHFSPTSRTTSRRPGPAS